jgi:hypothetical protein
MGEDFHETEELKERLSRLESQNGEIIETLHFLRKAVYYSRAWSVFKIIIIIIPLFIGAFYLPSFLRSSLKNINLPIDPNVNLFLK